MLFRPFGMYPEGTFRAPNGIFHASSSGVFSIVHGNDWKDLDADLPYSEFDWASPQELRLLGSLVLCEKRNECYLSLYPITRYSPYLDVDHLDFNDPALVERMFDLLRRKAASADMIYGEGAVALCLSGDVNLVTPDHYNLERLPVFWERTLPNNYVLMRGLAALIKADMLCHYQEFWEEALLSVYVALEASFHLVLQNLRAQGVRNPSAHDAAVWLHEHFDKDFGHAAPGEMEKYFEDFYDERVMTLHPASRYGVMPYSPTMHDDVIHLRRSLREIFSYLVSGSHAQDYFDDIQRTTGAPRG